MIDLGNGYFLSTDPEAMQLDAIHAYLTRSYWSTGIPLATVRTAIANSIGVGVFEQGAQVGFGRVTTDRATFAYLADVYVLEEHQGQGLAQAMVKALHDADICVRSYKAADLKNCLRITITTDDVVRRVVAVMTAEAKKYA